MARTDTLPHFLTDVADAIREKKGSEDTIQASDFDTEIENLPSGGGADLSDYFVTKYEGNSGVYLIKKFPNITIPNGWENVASLFEGFGNISEASVTFANDISGLVSLSSMCSSCGMLTSFTINGNYDFAEVTDISYIFSECSALMQLDLSKLHCSSLEYGSDAFNGCTSLEFLDVRNIDFTTLVDYGNMFGEDDTRFNPDCEIIVGDQTQKDWVETNFDFLTNVKTVAEYEAE